MGYLLVNLAILGENDQITVHDSAFIKDPVIYSSLNLGSNNTPFPEKQFNKKKFERKLLRKIKTTELTIN